MENALIAMSGGVDSSVAAYLTIKSGYRCMGGTMRLWEGGSDPLSGVRDAQAVAEKLQIPFYVLDGTDIFRAQVVEPFIQAYESGLTPNPCIRCNRFLKFGWLWEQAEKLGCQYVVTGHYARIVHEPDGTALLYRAPDPQKDQSYFLAGLTQQQLRHALFPLGDMNKEQVRQLAQAQGFGNARKRDSQDICFIPDGDYKGFMEQYTGKQYPCGSFLDPQGQVIGQHCGAVGYTLGQRKGLGIAVGHPVYVCGKDMSANTVTVGEEALLFSRTLWANDCNFIPFDHLTAPMRVTVKARSRHLPQPATVYPEENGIRVEFDSPQRAVTPGQAVVLYDGDLVIGAGTITRAG